MPNSFGHCPTEIVIADPVMKPAIAGLGMKSTMIPRRTRPIKTETMPPNKASSAAISGPVYCGFEAVIDVMVWPINRDITAVGPIVISLDVPKIQSSKE